MQVYRTFTPFHGFADPAARRPQNLQLQLARVDSDSNSRSCMAESSIQNLEFQSRAMAYMHGPESTAARGCKFSFLAGRRVAPLRGSTSPPAFEISFKILGGECVGPIGRTRAQKIGTPCPDFLRPRSPNRTYTLALRNFKTYFFSGTARGIGFPYTLI